MRQALRTVDGVASAEVSYDDERAWVRYDPTRSGPEDLILAIDLAGFGASVVE